MSILSYLLLIAKNQINQIVAERSYLRSLAGGCSIPVFVSAAIQKTTLVLTGEVI